MDPRKCPGFRMQILDYGKCCSLQERGDDWISSFRRIGGFGGQARPGREWHILVIPHATNVIPHLPRRQAGLMRFACAGRDPEGSKPNQRKQRIVFSSNSRKLSAKLPQRKCSPPMAYQSLSMSLRPTDK